MARSKSKRRSNSTNDSAPAVRVPSRIKQAGSLRANQELAAETPQQIESASSEEGSTSAETAVELLERMIPTPASEWMGAADSDSDPIQESQFLTQQHEIESALEQVNHWLIEASESQYPSNLDQKLDPSQDADPSAELKALLTDYRQATGSSIAPCPPCEPTEFENLMPISNPAVTSVDLDQLSHRLEANLAAMEIRLELVLNSVESKLNVRFSQLLDSMNNLPDILSGHCALSNSALETRQEPNVKTHSFQTAPADSSWETRKRQLLSDFGMSSEEIEQMVPDGNPAKDADKTKVQSKVETGSLEALQNSLETLDKIDAGIHSEEIDRLKEQLTSQLREAEVELSINRARLSKEWAALEQRTSELNQRESALKSKYHDVDSSSKHGLLDRITRHLSRKS